MHAPLHRIKPGVRENRGPRRHLTLVCYMLRRNAKPSTRVVHRYRRLGQRVEPPGASFRPARTAPRPDRARPTHHLARSTASRSWCSATRHARLSFSTRRQQPRSRGRQPRRRGSPLDHRQHEPPVERPARQPPRRRVHGLEERRLQLLEPARLDVGVEGRSRAVVGRHVVPGGVAASPGPLPEVVLPPNPQHRAHPREAVEHDREERPVPEPGQGVVQREHTPEDARVVAEHPLREVVGQNRAPGLADSGVGGPEPAADGARRALPPRPERRSTPRRRPGASCSASSRRWPSSRGS